MSLFGRDKGFPGWDAVKRGHSEVAAPFNKREQTIEQEHNDWFQRELRRPGSVVETVPPEEFVRALAIVRRQRASALAKYYDGQAEVVRTEEARLCDVVLTQSDALLAALSEHTDFVAEHRGLARACGRNRPLPQRLEPIRQALAEWRELERRRNIVATPSAPTPLNPIRIPEVL